MLHHVQKLTHVLIVVGIPAKRELQTMQCVPDVSHPAGVFDRGKHESSIVQAWTGVDRAAACSH